MVCSVSVAGLVEPYKYRRHQERISWCAWILPRDALWQCSVGLTFQGLRFRGTNACKTRVQDSGVVESHVRASDFFGTWMPLRRE